MTTTFGYEFEVYRNGDRVLDTLYNLGVVPENALHGYHCGCEECRHTNYGPNDEWLFSAQEDCTVSAEFPSKVLEWGSDRAESAFRAMERASVSAGAVLTGASGMHVHVAKPVQDEDVLGDKFTHQEQTTWRLMRMFVRYQDELRDIAMGHRDEVRRYNQEMSVRDPATFWNLDLNGSANITRPRNAWYGNRAHPMWYADGSWLDTERHGPTYEFRLWNASKAAWRQRLCVGVSVAMTQAAADGVVVNDRTRKPIERTLSPYLDDETYAGILRQRYSKGGMA